MLDRESGYKTQLNTFLRAANASTKVFTRITFYMRNIPRCTGVQCVVAVIYSISARLACGTQRELNFYLKSPDALYAKYHSCSPHRFALGALRGGDGPQ